MDGSVDYGVILRMPWLCLKGVCTCLRDEEVEEVDRGMQSTDADEIRMKGGVCKQRAVICNNHKRCHFCHTLPLLAPQRNLERQISVEFCRPGCLWVLRFIVAYQSAQLNRPVAARKLCNPSFL